MSRILPRIGRRQSSTFRVILLPVCLLLGHQPSLLRPIVPNPYATDSRIWACARCTRLTRNAA